MELRDRISPLAGLLLAEDFQCLDLVSGFDQRVGVGRTDPLHAGIAAVTDATRFCGADGRQPAAEFPVGHAFQGRVVTAW